MAGDGKINMPGSFGGLMRFDEASESKLRISPAAVIGIVIAVTLVIVALKVFWPVVA
jgi:preprotein translocase subunit Sec61beta